MKRFLFAFAVVALAAYASATAQPPVTTQPVPGPVIVGTPGTQVVEYAPAPARRGLFGRFRNRNNTPTYSAPIMPGPIMTAPPTTFTPTPMPGVVPTPMPGRTGIVIPAESTTLPPGTYTATDGTIIQVGGTQMQPTLQPIMQPTTQRRGLFGRMRGGNTRTPVMPSTPVMPMPTPPPGTTLAPMPQPSTSFYTPPNQPGSVVIPAGGTTLPPGTYTATDGTIIQVGGTQMQPTLQPTMQPTTQRRGLFGRMRYR
ncbi:MAG: hypothetical protein L0241_01480 [Planctomycetia bacterium]|nr:hypothetical protein [Planctomycetia bacterium]